jgi:hypothetical protein
VKGHGSDRHCNAFWIDAGHEPEVTTTISSCWWGRGGEDEERWYVATRGRPSGPRRLSATARACLHSAALGNSTMASSLHLHQFSHGGGQVTFTSITAHTIARQISLRLTCPGVATYQDPDGSQDRTVDLHILIMYSYCSKPRRSAQQLCKFGAMVDQADCVFQRHVRRQRLRLEAYEGN